MTTFVLTEEHVKLLRAMYVSWDDCEFGAPAIDPKRPYGNSDVISDIAEELGWTRPDGDEDDDFEWPVELDDRARQLHAETKTALQCVPTTGSFEPGTFKQNLHYRWERTS